MAAAVAPAAAAAAAGEPSPAAPAAGSPLFRPFRALGYITDDVPFAVQRRGKEAYVTVSVGRTWQVYSAAKLTLVMVGPPLARPVRALAVKGDLTFAATGSAIEECRRMHKVGEYRGHTGAITALLVIGDRLLSIGADRRLLVWAIGRYDGPEAALEFGATFEPTCLAHPDTYLNKVVVGAADGRLALWNFATGARLHEFAGWGSAVRCIAPSPALDVVGVGLADGRAVVANLRYDAVVASFDDAAGAGAADERFAASSGSGSGGPNASARRGVRALAFRSGAGVPLLAAGGARGAIGVWNLAERRLHGVLRDAHDGPLLSLHFFPGEPLLMSSAADNSIKQWAFDGADATARLLRFRSGHASPPTIVAHYAQGHRLLSAGGADRALRVFSTIQDQQSRELSQRHVARRAKRLRVAEAEVKLARLTALDAAEARERDWANMVSAHDGDATAYTWRLAHFVIGEARLRPPAGELSGRPAAPVTAVAVSPCGNFAVVGSAAGRVDRYNMQSGLHRGAYFRSGGGDGNPLSAAAAAAAAAAVRERLPAHDGAVAGVAVDACNRLLITLGAADGALRAWDFKRAGGGGRGALRAEALLGCGGVKLALHHGSGLAAAAGSDHTVRVYDIEAGCRLVRRFAGHRDRVTSIAIASDCRWLLSASLDGTVRAWDVPAGVCLQAMAMGAPVTCLSLSPVRDLLATTHANKRGVFLWANETMFGDGRAGVALLGSDGAGSGNDAPVPVALPSISMGVRGGDGDDEGGAGRAGAGSSDDDDDDVFPGPRPAMASDDDDDDDADDEDASDEGGRTGRAQNGQAAAAAAAAAASAPPRSRAVDAAGGGAPQPLAPELVTLSLLPRAQWETLMHLDAIKARSKPAAPPKKPEAAPFFLPTVPGLEGRPVFDVAGNAGGEGGESGRDAVGGKASGGGALAGWGVDGDDGGEDDGEDAMDDDGGGDSDGGGDEDDDFALTARRGGGGGGGGGSGPASRVVRAAPSAGAPASQFVRLLRAGGAGGDFASFLGHARGLSPAALDRELRALALAYAAGGEGAEEEEEEQEGTGGGGGGSAAAAAAAADIGLLLAALEGELAAGRNYEFVQALLRRVLEVHGDALVASAPLAAAAARVHARLRASWARVGGLLAGARAVVDFLAGAQG